MSADVERSITGDLMAGRSVCWVRGKPEAGRIASPRPLEPMLRAARRWSRFEPVLPRLFPGLGTGCIESELLSLAPLAERFRSNHLTGSPDRFYVKVDSDLPIAGSIKARGGLYEVLAIAERVAVAEGILGSETDDHQKLLTPEAIKRFSAHRICVGSTGNLGFAVGTAAIALGFGTTVHMSADAKAWKKERLRELGAEVVEHRADYGDAVAAARHAASASSNCHFIDDERSEDLFFGYSVAALRLREQLQRAELAVDEDHPLIVYLPCGVGGAPGGILYGLKAIFGEAAIGVLVEPTASPAMLWRLLSGRAGTSVYELGLSNLTEADGLAVAAASELVVDLVGDSVSAVCTCTDAEMLSWVWRAHAEMGLRLEPAGAAGFPVALDRVWLGDAARRLHKAADLATHVIWATGGGLLPDAEFDALLAAGREAAAASSLWGPDV